MVAERPFSKGTCLFQPAHVVSVVRLFSQTHSHLSKRFVVETMTAATEKKHVDNISSIPDFKETETASRYKDGTVDGDLDVQAVGGGSMEDLPANYYRSPQFIGTFFVRFSGQHLTIGAGSNEE